MDRATDLGIRLNDAVDEFLIDCAARRLTSQTRSGYKQKLSVLQRWSAEQEIIYLEQLTHRILRRFFVVLIDRELSGQYQHNIARTVRAFLNFCVVEELIDKSPFEKLKMPQLPKHNIVYFDVVEIDKVLRACQTERDKAICMVLLDTGLRASELIALRIDDVDIKAGTLTIHQGKGQKDRYAYVGAKTRRQVQRYLRQRLGAAKREALFVSQRGDFLRLDGLVQFMERLRRRSGVDKCTTHTFRRTFAINCLRNGMNVYVLAKLMGHVDIVVLKKYLALIEQDLQSAHAQYGVVDNL